MQNTNNVYLIWALSLKQSTKDTVDISPKKILLSTENNTIVQVQPLQEQSGFDVALCQVSDCSLDKINSHKLVHSRQLQLKAALK